MNPNRISHDGIVNSIEGNTVYVCISAESACAKCHAKGACLSLDTKEKIIEVQTDHPEMYHVGDAVIVSTDMASGNKAVLLGYVLPFLVLIGSLFLVLHFSGSEAIAGLSALMSVAVYYLFLYLSNRLLRQTFRFYISHR